MNKKVIALFLSVMLVVAASIPVEAASFPFWGDEQVYTYYGSLGLVYDGVTASIDVTKVDTDYDDIYTWVSGTAYPDPELGGLTNVTIAAYGWNGCYFSRVYSGLKSAECAFYVEYNKVKQINASLW